VTSASAGALSPRQQEIVDVARTLLTRQGVDALTLGRVAQALGIKPPSLYKHFPSKRALEAVLIAEGMRMWAEAMEAAGPTLADIVAAYRRFARANPELYRLMTDRPLPRDLLPEGLEARAAAPVVRAAGDPDLARAVWAFAHGMVVLELAGRFPPDAELEHAWGKAVEAFSAARAL
jgi:AcrR family transcriptional regulator